MTLCIFLPCIMHCVKSVRIWSYSGPYYPTFGLNTERYRVSPRIQSKCGKVRTRITPNTDTSHAVMRISISRTNLSKKFSHYINRGHQYHQYGDTLLLYREHYCDALDSSHHTYKKI